MSASFLNCNRSAPQTALAAFVAVFTYGCGTSQPLPDAKVTVPQSVPISQGTTAQPAHTVDAAAPPAMRAKEICIGTRLRCVVPIAESRLGIYAISTKENADKWIPDFIQIWDVVASKKVFSIEVPKSRSPGALPLSASLASWTENAGDRNHQLVLFDLDKRQKKSVFALPPEFYVQRIAQSRSGSLLAWIEINGEIKGLSKDGNYIAQEHKIRVAEIKSGKVIADIMVPLFSEYQFLGCLAISPDDRLIAFGGKVGMPAVGVINIKEQKVLWKKKACSPDAIAFDSNSKSFWATNAIGELTRFDAMTGREMEKRVVNAPDRLQLLNPLADSAPDRLLAVDVSPDGRYVAIGTDYTSKVMIWDVRTGKLLVEHKMSSPIESALRFTLDSKGVWAAGTLDECISYIPIPSK